MPAETRGSAGAARKRPHLRVDLLETRYVPVEGQGPLDCRRHSILEASDSGAGWQKIANLGSPIMELLINRSYSCTMISVKNFGTKF